MSIELWCERTGRRTFAESRQLVLGRRFVEHVLTRKTLGRASTLTPMQGVGIPSCSALRVSLTVVENETACVAFDLATQILSSRHGDQHRVFSLRGGDFGTSRRVIVVIEKRGVE